MTTTVALWTSIAITSLFALGSIEAEEWVSLLGQGASLVLLGYVAWKVHRCGKRAWRKKDTD